MSAKKLKCAKQKISFIFLRWKSKVFLVSELKLNDDFQNVLMQFAEHAKVSNKKIIFTAVSINEF